MPPLGQPSQAHKPVPATTSQTEPLVLARNNSWQAQSCLRQHIEPWPWLTRERSFSLPAPADYISMWWWNTEVNKLWCRLGTIQPVWLLLNQPSVVETLGATAPWPLQRNHCCKLEAPPQAPAGRLSAWTRRLRLEPLSYSLAVIQGLSQSSGLRKLQRGSFKEVSLDGASATLQNEFQRKGERKERKEERDGEEKRKENELCGCTTPKKSMLDLLSELHARKASFWFFAFLLFQCWGWSPGPHKC